MFNLFKWFDKDVEIEQKFQEYKSKYEGQYTLVYDTYFKWYEVKFKNKTRFFEFDSSRILDSNELKAKKSFIEFIDKEESFKNRKQIEV